MVHRHHASILHCYGDMALQILDAQTWTRKERWKKGKRMREAEGKKRKKESGQGKGRKSGRKRGKDREKKKEKKGKEKGEGKVKGR